MSAERPHPKPRTPIEWAVSVDPVPYGEAMAAMTARATAIRDHDAPQLIWLLEHPPLYTAGTSAKREDLLVADRFPVYEAGRGGQFTYHGPAQRIAYVMLDMRQLGGDVRGLVASIERWVIRALAAFGVTGERREGRVGIWVRRPDKGEGKEDKIAAIGLRVSRSITTHGLSLNVAPDLTHYAGIVPCGIAEHGVTSLADLGKPVSMAQVDIELRRAFEDIFGPTILVTAPTATHPAQFRTG